MLELFAQISQLSLSLQNLTETSIILDECSPEPSSQIAPLVNQLTDLQDPDLSYLFDELILSGCTKGTAGELVSVHAKRCADLADHYQEIYSNICRELLPTVTAPLGGIIHTIAESSSLTKIAGPRKLQQLYHQTTLSWTKDLLRSVRVRLASNEMKGYNQPRNKFNQEFVPVLEKILEISPFPSRAVKKALAKSSGMTSRQISVWFQNRRSRTKKGDAMRSSSALSESQCMSRDEENSDAETFVTSDPDIDTDAMPLSSRSSSCTIVEGSVYSFSWKSPEYAFPTPYPPEFVVDPFPRQPDAFIHSKIEWRRANATRTHNRDLGLDIAALSNSFDRLSLNDTEPVDGLDSSTIGFSEAPGCNPFGVRFNPAPLPSLVIQQRVHKHVGFEYPREGTSSSGLRSASCARPTPVKCNRTWPSGHNLTVAQRFDQDNFNLNLGLGDLSYYQDIQRRKRSILSFYRTPSVHSSHLCRHFVNNEPKSAFHVSRLSA